MEDTGIGLMEDTFLGWPMEDTGKNLYMYFCYLDTTPLQRQRGQPLSG